MISRMAFILVALVVTTGPALAQLELPKEPVTVPRSDPVVLPDKRGDLADDFKTAGKGKGTEAGTQPEGSKPELSLPKAAPVKTAKQPESQPAPEPLPPIPTGSGAAAEFILAELGKLGPDELEHRLMGHSERSLMGLGDEGVDAARRALYLDHPPTLITVARVLLRSGRPEAAELVQRRLAERLPRHAGPPLFEALIELDPVRASPTYLAELLGHPQAAIRSAAQRRFEEQSSPSMLGALLPALEHQQTDTRLRAVQIVSGVRDPAVLPLLIQRLKDRSSTVAARAVTSLALLDDERVDDELLRRAFGLRWILREGAYALLAIVEREDKQLTTILNPSHAEPLLVGLGSSDVFVSGSCASALAGLGFRSDLEAAWLDRTVPHRLVRVVGGEDFHNDYSALQPIALRRLSLLTGEHFGSDGPRWLNWWAENALSFHPRRAVLAVTSEDAGRIEVVVRSTFGLPSGFRLLGAEATALDPTALELETVRMTVDQARRLFAVLEEEGTFGVQRLPGPRGDVSGGASELEVRIGDHRKGFSFAEGRDEAWFERVVATAEQLRQVNRWQRFLPDDDPAQAQARWELEAAWWESEPGERERGLRLKRMVLDHLASRRPSDRDTGATELANLLSSGDLVEAADFSALVDLLRGEFFVGPRARTFIRGALDAARLAGGDDMPEPQLVRELVDVLLEGFGPEAALELSEVFLAAGRDVTHEAAADPRAFVRAVAAATLAKNATEADYAVLEGLLADGDQAVQVATVLALGDNAVEAARTELLVRARVGELPVRVAALRAVGRLGGEGVFDALLVGLAERDHPEVGVAAAEGLALLGDPSAAPLFVSILAKGPDHPAFEAARDGLLRLGPAAQDPLLRAVHSPGHRARREAALLLSRQLVPEVASTLMSMLSDTPGDVRVAEELAVLTCVDFRAEPDPSLAWWNWWELVVHDDSNAWLIAALEREGIAAPPAGALPVAPGGGTEAGARYFLGVLTLGESHLAERARRGLEWCLSAESDPETPGNVGLESIEAVPGTAYGRHQWIQALRDRLDARYN